MNMLLQPAFIGPGGSELVVVMLVMLVLFGSKDAPRMLRKLNEVINQIRRTAEHFKREVMYGDIETSPPPYGRSGEDEAGDNDPDYIADDYSCDEYNGAEQDGTEPKPLESEKESRPAGPDGGQGAPEEAKGGGDDDQKA